ncbi:MAG: Ig domain-containing protein [Gemmatimonadales bacterium]
MRRLLAVLVVVAACGGVTTPDSSPVKSIAVTLSAYQIVVGSTSQGQAAMFDAQGVPVTDRPPTWSSLTPTVVSVTSAGVITGLQAGLGVVRATAGSVTGDAQVVVTNPRAASITLSRDTATVFVPSGSVQLIPTVKDSGGTLITNPTILWQSTAPLIAGVNASGLVSALAVGTTTIRASIDGKVAQSTIIVKVTPNATAPLIVSINPAILRPGGTYTVVGNNFAPTAGANAVVVDGVPVTVTQATANALSITLPATGFSCDPSRSAFVQVTVNGLVGGGSATLSVPNPRSLAPGQSIVISNATEVRCNELVNTGSRYVLSVYNAYRATVTPSAIGGASLTLRGAIGDPATGVVVAARTAPLRPSWDGAVSRIGSPAYDRAEAIRRTRVRDQAHGRLLERNIEFLRRSAGALASLHGRPGFAGGLAAAGGPSTTIGAISPVKIPNIDASNFCATSNTIGARTVFVGQHSIILEDTVPVANGKATLQGQMNSYFTQIGQEFDSVMWPILVGNFGNPLVLDASLSGTGKVVMVFSPRVNAFQSGDVLGFAVTCDLAPVSQSPSSNVGEYFYATVPTSAAAGYADGETRDSWLRLIQATIVHEVKHITSFGERLSRGLAFEDVSWEEGMARNVEELYARTFYGNQQKQNAGYAATIACDLRYLNAAPPCANRPVLMLRHFDGLETYFSQPESYSPLGRTFAADATIYASAWSLQRWANDHFAANESQFLKDFTTSTVTGVQNLEARTGHPWEEMLGEWSIGMYLDDEPGFAPENPHLKFPSWNLRDIWLGLCSDLGPCANPGNTSQLYPRPNPFQPHAIPFGVFSINGSLAGGAFAIFELTGTQAAKQLIEVRSLSGGDPASTIRLAIVRVQ